MAVNKKVVKLFYDVVSHYTYVSFEVLTKHCQQHWPSMDLQLKPVFALTIFEKSGNTPPGLLPAKGRYMKKDLYRLTEYYGINFKFPKNVIDALFVKGTLKPQMLLTAVKQESPTHLEHVSRLLFQGLWVKDIDITKDETLKAVCIKSGITNDMSNKLVGMAQDTQIKEELDKVTEEAIEYGAFGLPVYVVEHNGKPQTMFGTDRIFLLAHYLEEKWPLPFTEQGSRN